MKSFVLFISGKSMVLFVAITKSDMMDILTNNRPNRSTRRQPKIGGYFDQRRNTSKHFEAKRIPFTSGDVSPWGGWMVSGC